MPDAPQSSGDAPIGGVDAETLRRITKLEHDTKQSTGVLTFVNDTNKFILVVLFIGFIGLILAIIVVVLNAVKDDTHARNELTSQVQALNYELQHSTVTPNN